MSDVTVPGDAARVPPGAEERTGSDRASIYDVSFATMSTTSTRTRSASWASCS
jgi:hypothetical protein